MPKYLAPIDLAKNELKNARIQNLAADPSSPVAGQVYYNTGSNKFRVYNGTTWDEMGSGGGDASTNTATSVDSEVALFSGTGGKTLKRATISGLAKLASGVLSAAVAGTDYVTGSSTNTFTNKTFDANGTGNSITNIETADFATNVIDNDATLAANSATRIATQAAVKGYVDAVSQGVKWKTSVRVATTAAGTLATSFENGDSVDGVTLATGDRILIKDQAAPAENGIYTVNASGAPTRATDADTGVEIKAASVTVEEGTANADTSWVNTNNGTVTLGSTGITFVSFLSANVPTATTSVAGKVQLATVVEAQAKTDSTKAVTPAGLTDFTRKYSATIGDGSTTAIAVTHSLGTKDVITQIRQVSDDAVVEADIVNTSTTVTTITFATAPASSSIRVVIQG